MKVIAALRELNKDEMPERVFGCEVWRDLDWLCDEDKIYLDTSAHPNIARALSAVFDSQILGGKRYDIAAEGRRCANATYSESHACDTHEGLNYAMDLTPLILDKKLKVSDFISAHIQKIRAHCARKSGVLRQGGLKMDYRNTRMWEELNAAPAILQTLAAKNAGVLDEIAKAAKGALNAYTVARGTSDHAMMYFKYLAESILGLPSRRARPASLRYTMPRFASIVRSSSPVRRAARRRM